MVSQILVGTGSISADLRPPGAQVYPLSATFIGASSFAATSTLNTGKFPAAGQLALSPTPPVAFASLHHPITVPQGNARLTTLPPGLLPGTFIYPDAAQLHLSPTAPSAAVAKLRHWLGSNHASGTLDNVTDDLRGSVSDPTDHLRAEVP